MNTIHRKLITIITEAALEKELIRDIERLGARGYTVSEARGKGHRGVRDAGWDEARNIRMEVVCDEALAAAISAHLQKRYYENYAMISFVADVAVLRDDKF
jgi:nitrogen regulatory protein PII